MSAITVVVIIIIIIIIWWPYLSFPQKVKPSITNNFKFMGYHPLSKSKQMHSLQLIKKIKSAQINPIIHTISKYSFKWGCHINCPTN